MPLEYTRSFAHRTDAGRNDPPPAPPNTAPLDCAPNGVEVGDYIFVAGKNRRVNDMRSRGGTAERVLLLEGFGPWVMTTVHQIYRTTSPARLCSPHRLGAAR